jgi:hypothetical protein
MVNPQLRKRKIVVLGSRSVGESTYSLNNQKIKTEHYLIFREVISCETVHRGILGYMVKLRMIIISPSLEPFRWFVLSNYRIDLCEECRLQRNWIWLPYNRHCWTGKCCRFDLEKLCIFNILVWIQDEYSPLNSQYAIGIHGYILVYSITSKNSFNMMQVVYDKIVNFCGVPKIPCVIVGSKSDLSISYVVSFFFGW